MTHQENAAVEATAQAAKAKKPATITVLKKDLGVALGIEKLTGREIVVPKLTDTAFACAVSDHYVLREAPLRDLLAYLSFPNNDALMIIGPTGSGKTSLVTETAARLGWGVVPITCSGRTEFTDVVGQYVLASQTPGEQPQMTFQYGPLAKAMKEGHIFLINEFNMLHPDEASGLNDVLEGRPLVIEANGGEVIRPHPMFRCVVTANMGKTCEGATYTGTKSQNLAALDRYRVTEVDYPTKEEETLILQRVAPELAPLHEHMINTAQDVRTAHTEGLGDTSLQTTLSTRVLCRWATLTLAYRAANNAAEYALERALTLRLPAEEKEAVHQMAKARFGEAWVAKPSA